MSEQCPTCGGPVTVAGEGLTHWYQPQSPPIIDVARLNVQPGEVLAVRLPMNTAMAEVDKVRAWFAHMLPAVHILVISAEVGFAVISAEAAAEAQLAP
jgi:hypothetical protein